MSTKWYARIWQWRATLVTLASLIFFAVFTLSYVQPLAQQMQTIREIYNKVFDAANNRLMTTPWAGAQGVVYTETEILNRVFDAANNLLRTSGGGGVGGSSAFSDITTSTNTTATMTVGLGAQMIPAPGGIIKATGFAVAPAGCTPSNLYSQGIDINAAAICKQVQFTELGGTIGDSQLANVGTPGSCTNCNLTIDNKGRVTAAANGSAGGGPGDFSSNTATSVDGEVLLFSGTTGKLGKRATGTGIPKVTAGVFGIATPGTDYVTPGGNVATATALAADPPDCSIATQYAQGIIANGSATCKQVQFNELGGTVGNTQLPTVVTGGNCTNCNLTVDSQGRVTALANGSAGGSAPVGATYWTSSSDATLTNETNLGALTSGLLKHTVTGGVSTPATAVAGTDYVVPGGTVATASALTTDPPNCSPTTTYAQGIAADGSAQCKMVQFSELGGQIGAGQLPTVSTPGSCTTCNITVDAQGRVTAYGSGSGSGGGDFISDAAASVDGELVLYAGTTGKHAKRATQTGIPKLASGVLGIATPGTDYVIPSGNVATATALASDPPDCTVTSQYAQGITAAGNATCKQVLFTELGGSVADSQLPTKVTAGGCTNCNITFDAQGRAASYASGSVGDFSTNTALSVDSEVVLFSGTTGKQGKRATGTGIPKLTAGVLSIATAGTDYVAPGGNAATATALQNNPADCTAPAYAQSIAANGDLGCKQVIFSELGGSVGDSQLPTKVTGGNCTNCNLTVDNQGRVTALASGTGGGGVTTSGSPAANQTAEFTAPTVITGVANTGTGSYVKGTGPVITNAFWSAVNLQAVSSYTLLASDNGKLVVLSAATTVNIPQATTAGFTAGAVFYIKNTNTVVATLTPATSTIDGFSSVELRPGATIALHSNGTNYYSEYNTASTTPMSTSAINHADAATINVDAHLYNEVRVAELSQPTLINTPTFSPGVLLEGQRLTYDIWTTTSRALTYGAGFAGTGGINLPKKTIATAHLVLEFRYSTKDSLWILILVSDKKPDVVAGTDVASITIDCNAAELYSQAADAQTSYAFQNPSCTPYDGQMLRVRMTTAGTAKPITFPGAQFTAGASIALPTATSGGNIEDIFGFMRNDTLGTWVMVATTQNPTANKRRRCIIQLGDESSGVALTDAQIVDTKACRVFGAATVEEIGIEAMGAFQPSVLVHTRANNTTNTPLLSGALPAGTSGAYACARATAGTGLAGVSCGATLQNNTIAAGNNTIGITSGTANSTTNVTVTISFIEQ